MYIQHIKRCSKNKSDNKFYTSTILAESYREDGKMKRRVIANLSKVSDEVISAMKLALSAEKVVNLNDLTHQQGKCFGALFTCNEIAKRLGITAALDSNTEGKLALLQIFSRIISQGSRLFTAQQWVHEQAVEEVLRLGKFNEDNLYKNLDWLCENQDEIEDKLFAYKYKDKQVKDIYLYDVTSSYFEGKENELAEYGYNRDKKRGKKQIVIGLLCDQDGDPISVEVFKGNTGDTTTVASQLVKLQKRFGVERMVMVGDKGMIKSAQIDDLLEMKYHYITTITKPQINKLLVDDVFQLSLFDENMAEITHDDIRYIMRRNPLRQQEISSNRCERIESINDLIKQENTYLKEHPRAKIAVAKKRIESKINARKLTNILTCDIVDNKLQIKLDNDSLEEKEKLDGCYCIKTDLRDLDKQVIHDRYKDLAMVENAFRTLKTGLEEIRPIFLRKESRTRGHVFVCMLAYKIVRYIWQQTRDNTDLSQKGIIQTLDNIQFITYDFSGCKIKKLPKILNNNQKQILEDLKLKLPGNIM